MRFVLGLGVCVLGLGCESVPSVQFVADCQLADACADPVQDATTPPDAGTEDTGADDAASPPFDAMDAATTCLPPQHPANASCCNAAQCVGLACNHCPECRLAACGGGANYCCAQVNGNGKYKGMGCSNTPASCPP